MAAARTDRSVRLVLDTMAEMHAAPSTLAHGDVLRGREAGWPTVAADPTAFLSLGLVGPAWLDRTLPTLIAAEQSCRLSGDALAHFDLRSDNLCLTANGVKFIDYDLPDLKTKDGVATFGTAKNSWCNDSEGNVLGFVEGM